MRIVQYRLVLMWLLAGLLLAGSGLFYYSKTRLATEITLTEVTQEAISTTAALIGALADLQASHRVYAATGNPAFLTEYDEALQRVPSELGKLRSLLGDQPNYQSALDRLEADLSRARMPTVTSQVGPQGKQQVPLVNTRAFIVHVDAARKTLVDFQLNLLNASTKQRSLRNVMGQRNAAIYTVIVFTALFGLGGILLLGRHLSILREEEALRIKVRESQRESREKSTFLATVSHEIRTPLNAISGFSRLLNERVEDPLSRKYVEAIKASGETLIALINNVLDLSKIEAGKLEIHPTPVNLREIADTVITMFSELAAEKNLSLRSLIRPTVPTALELDELRIKQVLFNLVGNAVKCTNQGHVILGIGATLNSDDETRVTCVITVADTGVGIPKELLDRIFDPFVQAGAGADAKAEGSGLGLSITRQLTQLMGGEISAISEPGKGSIFRVELKRVPIAVPSKPVARRHGHIADLPPSTVLIVDDVALNRELLEAIFKNTHHRTISASTGQQALELARAHRPHIILLDIRLPDIDGIEVLRRIRQDRALAGSWVIAVTASSFAGDQAKLKRLFDGYIAKPFSDESLYEELQHVLSNRADAVADSAAPQSRPSANVQKELRRLESTVWPVTRQTMAMHEVRKFAQAVSDVATRASDCEPLVRYADQMKSGIEDFDIPALQRLLEEYPHLVRGLTHIAKSA